MGGSHKHASPGQASRVNNIASLMILARRRFESAARLLCRANRLSRRRTCDRNIMLCAGAAVLCKITPHRSTMAIAMSCK